MVKPHPGWGIACAELDGAAQELILCGERRTSFFSVVFWLWLVDLWKQNFD